MVIFNCNHFNTVTLWHKVSCYLSGPAELVGVTSPQQTHAHDPTTEKAVCSSASTTVVSSEGQQEKNIGCVFGVIYIVYGNYATVSKRSITLTNLCYNFRRFIFVVILWLKWMKYQLFGTSRPTDIYILTYRNILNNQ